MRRAAPLLRTLLPKSAPLSSMRVPLLGMAHTLATTATPARAMSVTPRFIISNVTSDEYTREANAALASIVDRLEEPDFDDVGDLSFDGDVLKLTHNSRTWVLNKHSASKQLWLSSPLSGPSKYCVYLPSTTGTSAAAASPNSGSSAAAAPDAGVESSVAAASAAATVAGVPLWFSERDGTTRLSEVLKKEFSDQFDTTCDFGMVF